MYSKILDLVLALVIVVFALWPAQYGTAVIVIAAVILFIKGVVGCCGSCSSTPARSGVKRRGR